VTRDAPDENMISSGCLTVRDAANFSSGRKNFFKKIVGNMYFMLDFLGNFKSQISNIKTVSSLAQNDRDNRDISSILEGP
jgi:hypothetical protein